MGIEQRMCSPAVLDKIVWADAEHKSTSSAKKAIQKLAEISVSAPTIREMSDTIGEELEEQLQQQAAAHANGNLQPEYPEPPQVAAVAIDGGRIMTRDKAGRGVHRQAWKETKNACLHTMSSKLFEEDPHPALPSCFANQAHVEKLVREIHSATVGSEEPPENLVSPLAEDECSLLRSDPVKPDGGKRRRKRPDWRPRKLVRTCVSSMVRSKDFGPLVAGEAQRRGFYQASRRAFLGDGQAWNWSIQEEHFQDFVPITDFVHPLGYIYNAAKAIAPQGCWAVYLKAATACWQGRVDEFLEELRAWLTDHPAPDKSLPDQDPRAVVQRAITYLENNQARMNYPDYRRQGLPTSTSAIESLIKEINYRVKGTEKFWNRPEGAEHILQIRAAALSDDQRLSNWILNRPGSYYYRPPKQGAATAA
jgi:hypothetical protein